MKYRIQFCCILVLWVNVSIAQSPSMRQIGLENGLPGLTVYQVLQDDKGYIWMGTQNGICRFDGREFKVWGLDQLADKEIIYLKQDKLGRVWFHNLSMQIGKIEDEEIEIVFDFVENDSIDGRVSAFEIAGSKLLLLRKKLTRNRYNYVFREYELDTSGGLIPINVYRDTLNTSIDRFFIENNEFFSPTVSIYNGKEYRFGIKDGKFTKYLADGNKYTGEKNRNLDILLITPEGASIYLDVSNLYISDKKGFRLYKDFKNIPVRSCELIGDDLWVLTTSGISVFDFKTGSEKSIFLSGTACNSVIKDRENNFWITTSERGVFVIPNFNISVYKSEDGLQKKEDVNSLIPSGDNKTLYVGTSAGEITLFDLKNFNTHQLNTGYQGRVMSMVEDAAGSIWVGQDKWLSIFTGPNERPTSTKKFGGIKKILASSENKIFIAQSHSVQQIEPYYRSGKPFIDRRLTIFQKRTYGLAEDGKGTIWIGSVEGLYLFKDNKVLPFMENGTRIKYNVSSVFYEPEKAIWVSTSDQGVLKIADGKVLKRLNTDNGLASNNCTSVFKSGGLLLIGTDKGLVVYNEKESPANVINNRSGLPTNNVRSVFADKENIWAGTSQGLARIPFAAIQPNLITPPIYLDGVSILGRDTVFKSHYNLKFNQNTLDINFTGIALKANGQERYKYRLKGLNDLWGFTDLRTARFHSLPSGDYTFEVYAINEEGIESDRPAELSFTIATPWWKTTWFYISAILGAMFLTGGLVYWRQNEKQNREKSESELREKIRRLSLEALQNQMNPHFIFNALNAIQDFFINKDYKSALFYLSKFAQLIRWIFDYSKQSTISLTDEIEFLNLYLEIEKMRFGDRVDIDFIVDEKIYSLSEDFEIPPLLIQPLIENCFKHGLMHKTEGGKLDLLFEAPHADVFHCRISDNGVGREKAGELSAWRHDKKKHGSLEVIKERLHIFHNAGLPASEYLKVADLTDEIGGPCGTMVDIFIYKKRN